MLITAAIILFAAFGLLFVDWQFLRAYLENKFCGKKVDRLP